jgi:hypothetical protein
MKSILGRNSAALEKQRGRRQGFLHILSFATWETPVVYDLVISQRKQGREPTELPAEWNSHSPRYPENGENTEHLLLSLYSFCIEIWFW